MVPVLLVKEYYLLLTPFDQLVFMCQAAVALDKSSIPKRFKV